MFFIRLQELCTAKGITITKLALTLGISRSNVTNWKNGSVPKSDKIQEIANYFNVSTDYLLGNEEKIYPSNMMPVDVTDYIMVPMLGEVAAGLGCLAENEIIGYEPFSASSIKAGHEYMCLQVKGDSMYPKLEEGDIVLVQCRNTVDSGSYAVLTVNGDEGVIKKVIYGKTWIELHSINPMYPIRRFEGEDVLKINVMGLVIESKRKF